MKRSGNHAVINWIKAQGTFLFFNNVVPIRPILLGKKPIPPPENFDAWTKDKVYASRIPLHGAFKRIAYARYGLITNVEDHDLKLKIFRNIKNRGINILIVRSPSNFFSSRIRRSTTIGYANRIVVITDGQIVEEGRHEQLLARRGQYYKLYQMQLADNHLP